MIFNWTLVVILGAASLFFLLLLIVGFYTIATKNATEDYIGGFFVAALLFALFTLLEARLLDHILNL